MSWACQCLPAGYDGPAVLRPRAASAQSLMLLLATVALIMPAIFQLVSGGGLPDPPRASGFCRPEDAVGRRRVILLISYAAGLWCSPQNAQGPVQSQPRRRSRRWSRGRCVRSVIMLAGAGVAVGVMSEILGAPHPRRRKALGSHRSSSASSSSPSSATPPSTGSRSTSPCVTRSACP